MNVEVINKIIENIYNTNKIAVLVHVNPDGDALGSGLAMYIALKQLKKEVDLIKLLEKTKYGKDGMGGLKVNGLMYVGYPR